MADPEEHGTPSEPIVRPAPHRWLWYALGGRLPERHRGWVLFDTTTRTWGLRHVGRMLVQMAVPIVLILVLLPAPFGLRVAVVGGGIFLGLIYSLAYMPETTETRVVKAGYPAGTATAYRDRASHLRDEQDRHRRRDPAAQRAPRHPERQGRRRR